MDLPTYTNVWRIEKRLYKLYDLRLPMPLPLVTIGVYAGSFLPWIVLLQFLGVPFGAPWHVLYLVPPGVVAWLATRPVIEGKRLNELLQSQARYLAEPRTWCRLTPIREPREVVVVARVWRSPRQLTPSLDALTEVPVPARAQTAPPTPATSDAPQPLSEYAVEYAAAHKGAVARMQAQMDAQHIPGPEPAERMPVPDAASRDTASGPLRTESVPPGAVPLDEPAGEPAAPEPAQVPRPRPEAPRRRALISGIRRPGEELEYWRPAESGDGTPTHAVRTTFDAAAIRQAAAAARAEEAARAQEAARSRPRASTDRRPPQTRPARLRGPVPARETPRPESPARVTPGTAAQDTPQARPTRAPEAAGPQHASRDTGPARDTRPQEAAPAAPREQHPADEDTWAPVPVARTEHGSPRQAAETGGPTRAEDPARTEPTPQAPPAHAADTPHPENPSRPRKAPEGPAHAEETARTDAAAEESVRLPEAAESGGPARAEGAARAEVVAEESVRLPEAVESGGPARTEEAARTDAVTEESVRLQEVAEPGGPARAEGAARVEAAAEESVRSQEAVGDGDDARAEEAVRAGAVAEESVRLREAAEVEDAVRAEEAARVEGAARAERLEAVRAEEAARTEAAVRSEEAGRLRDAARVEDGVRAEEAARAEDADRAGDAERAQEAPAHGPGRPGDVVGRSADGPSPSPEGDAAHRDGLPQTASPGSPVPVPEGDEAAAQEEHAPVMADEENTDSPVVGPPPATVPDIPKVPGSFGAASAPAPEEEQPERDERPAVSVSPADAVANRTDQQIWPPVPAPAELPPDRVSRPPTTAPDIPVVRRPAAQAPAVPPPAPGPRVPQTPAASAQRPPQGTPPTGTGIPSTPGTAQQPGRRTMPSVPAMPGAPEAPQQSRRQTAPAEGSPSGAGAPAAPGNVSEAPRQPGRQAMPSAPAAEGSPGSGGVPGAAARGDEGSGTEAEAPGRRDVPVAGPGRGAERVPSGEGAQEGPRVPGRQDVPVAGRGVEGAPRVPSRAGDGPGEVRPGREAASEESGATGPQVVRPFAPAGSGGADDEGQAGPPGSFGQRPRISAVEGEPGLGGRAPERSVWPGSGRERLPEPVRGRPVKPEPPRIVPPRRDELPPPPREVRSGPASPVRPRPTPVPVPTPPAERVQAITPPDQPVEEPGGLRRLLSRGNPVDQDYIERLQRPFQGTRRIVVLGCTGGAGQTVTTLMMGHTFAQYCGEPTVALDVNPGHGALARRTRIDTQETLTTLIANAEHIGSLSGIRRYTSRAKSGLDVVASGKTPLHALDDRDYAQAIRTLDRFYSVTLLDAAASVVSRVLPHADQIVLVAPASADAPRAVAMTFEWLDSHGYHDLRQRAVTVINGVSRRSQSDVEQAEQVARGQCRALVRIPWDDHLSLDRSPRNELKALRPPTRRAYLALSAVVAGGFSVLPERYQDPSPYQQERTQ